MNNNELDKLKRRLGITDDLQDTLLTDLYEDAESYFKALTGASEVASTYAFIIREVALKLYNRKGSEGMASESVDGYSVSYASDLFSDYMDLLERDFNLNNKYRKSGSVKFL
ncbi:phage head-tail connector protein [Facklamia hominis]|uniref:Phage head-tail connector protein n=1 Tax=Facklamia hominis TaxID=178214 RepID=A0AAJ1Q7F4_9LACT|nr:phage head-tail connector protein [Facklamia hominis]MDK7187931.1 phage head-tail connector protein [Facklamia hominis]